MPTGYTSDIEKGMTFNEFVLGCARAFGALVMMRDDPMDKPIPKKFNPSTYHVKELAKYRKKLPTLKGMTLADVSKRALEEYMKEVKDDERYIKNKRELKKKYEDMLAKVKEWTPPSPDHKGLKDFMIQQLTESINFDCSEKYHETPKQVTGEQWRREQIADCEQQIAYHIKENEGEIERAKGRTLWVNQLRKSLEGGAS